MVKNAKEFLEDYIYDLCFDLRNAIFNNDSIKDELQIKLDTAMEIAAGLGARAEIEEDTVTLPYVSIDWESNND